MADDASHDDRTREDALVVAGLRVVLRTSDDELRERLRRDFRPHLSMASDAHTVLRLTATRTAPPYEAMPAMVGGSIRHDHVVYDEGPLRVIDYQGEALARWDRDAGTLEVWASDLERLHELSYLLLQSRLGEALDAAGVHRVHALGLEKDGRACLVLLPSGGGKTTLGLAAIEQGFRLLSDDAPLVTRAGDVLGFVVRVGTTSKPGDVDERHLGRMVRKRYGPKWLIDPAAFADRWSMRATPGALVLGERALRGETSLRPATARVLSGELLRSMVIGLGLPQLAEVVLLGTAADTARKAAFAASRSVAAAQLVRRSSLWTLTLGPDVNANVAALHRALDGRSGSEPDA
jgi:hypothetical protein